MLFFTPLACQNDTDDCIPSWLLMGGKNWGWRLKRFPKNVLGVGGGGALLNYTTDILIHLQYVPSIPPPPPFKKTKKSPKAFSKEQKGGGGTAHSHHRYTDWLAGVYIPSIPPPPQKNIKKVSKIDQDIVGFAVIFIERVVSLFFLYRCHVGSVI